MICRFIVDWFPFLYNHDIVLSFLSIDDRDSINCYITDEMNIYLIHINNLFFVFDEDRSNEFVGI